MGYANCGIDTKGRQIGYAHQAVCDYPDCENIIHRGLAYACGSYHGAGSNYCDDYFCYEHQVHNEFINTFTCESCCNLAEKDKGEEDDDVLYLSSS